MADIQLLSTIFAQFLEPFFKADAVAYVRWDTCIKKLKQGGLISHDIVFSTFVLEFLNFFPHLQVVLHESGVCIQFSLHQCACNKEVPGGHRIDPAVICPAFFNHDKAKQGHLLPGQHPALLT